MSTYYKHTSSLTNFPYRFYNQLSASAERGARWRVIGSQTVFSRINESLAYGNVNPLDYDAWDGYQANRNRTLNHLSKNNIGNNIVISGDSHASWVSDLVWLDHASMFTLPMHVLTEKH